MIEPIFPVKLGTGITDLTYHYNLVLSSKENQIECDLLTITS